MPEWLRTAFQGSGKGLTFQAAAWHLVLAVACGFAIAWIHRRSVRRTTAASDSFAAALILLSPLVAMTAMVIDDNVARAFSLVGALSIVRFRTDVEDTRDTAFVIFSVVAGMAAGVGNWVLCAVGVPVVGLVALGLSLGPRAAAAAALAGLPQSLLVRIGTAENPKEALEPAMGRHVEGIRLVKTATARQGAALELTFTVHLRAGGDPVALVRELNAVKGVQHVELGEA